jgi:hypothetical protein
LNVSSVSDVRQIEIQTCEPLVPDPSCLQVETATAELKKYNSPCHCQILAVTQAGGKTLLLGSHKRINSIGVMMNFLIGGRSLLLYQFTKKAIKVTVIIIM